VYDDKFEDRNAAVWPNSFLQIATIVCRPCWSMRQRRCGHKCSFGVALYA